MTNTNDQKDDKEQRGRRKILGAAVGLAGGLVGVAVRAALAGARPTPAPKRLGARWAKSHVPGEGRMATAEEIAAFALTLASDEHPHLTGAALVIDGGKTAHAG